MKEGVLWAGKGCREAAWRVEHGLGLEWGSEWEVEILGVRDHHPYKY